MESPMITPESRLLNDGVANGVPPAWLGAWNCCGLTGTCRSLGMMTGGNPANTLEGLLVATKAGGNPAGYCGCGEGNDSGIGNGAGGGGGGGGTTYSGVKKSVCGPLNDASATAVTLPPPPPPAGAAALAGG